MKHKYCLIREPQHLNPGSYVYVVWAGSSLRESVQLTLVEEYCKDCGWYFKRWSPMVDSALEKRSMMSRTDGTRGVMPYTMISLSIHECYSAIIDDAWLKIESTHTMTPQETFLRFRHDPLYLSSYHRQSCNTTCPPSTRKYLSRRQWSEKTQVVACFAGIVLLIVLDAIVTNFIL